MTIFGCDVPEVPSLGRNDTSRQKGAPSNPPHSRPFSDPVGGLQEERKVQDNIKPKPPALPQIDILCSVAGSNVSCTVPGGPSYFMPLLLILIKFRGKNGSTHPQNIIFAEAHLV